MEVANSMLKVIYAMYACIVVRHGSGKLLLRALHTCSCAFIVFVFCLGMSALGWVLIMAACSIHVGIIQTVKAPVDKGMSLCMGGSIVPPRTLYCIKYLLESVFI